jgi:hypothetical protein
MSMVWLCGAGLAQVLNLGPAPWPEFETRV